MSVVTPSVFSILNEDEAGKLLRVIFRMFIYGLIVTILSCAVFFLLVN